MRRALFFFLPLLSGLPAFAQPPEPRWPVSGTIAESRLDVFWERCPQGAQEWEAFLSLDGGRSFPIRVTPHLSTKIRSFSWPIPRILSDGAKLRIRFGDGRTEREYDVDSSLTISPAVNARPLVPASRDLGERPAQGEEQTAAWVEWNGEGPRTVAPIAPPGLRSSSQWRSAAVSMSALPARRFAPARPSSTPGSSPSSMDREPPSVAELEGPSLAALSRLNL